MCGRLRVANPFTMRYNFGMNWGLIGHEWAVQLLKKQVSSGNLRQAYLITGPKGIGRRTLALRFAQTLNCQDVDQAGEPCFCCRLCELIEGEKHSDLAVVRTEEDGRVLKVEQIRELGRFLSLAPYETAYKVAILLNFEEANESAANALLKTLEEPASKSIIILTADSGESLLPTIVSRCEMIRLRPLAASSLAEKLQGKVDKPAAEINFLAHISGGCPGVVLNMVSDPELIAFRNNWLEEHACLLAANLVERFTFADDLSGKKEQISQILAVWLSLWRDILLRSSGSQAPVTNIDRIEEIVLFSHQLEVETVKYMVANIQHTIELLLMNVNPKLALENLMLKFPRIVS